MLTAPGRTTSSLEARGSVSPFRVSLSRLSSAHSHRERVGTREERENTLWPVGCLCLGNSPCVLDGNPRGCKRRRWAYSNTHAQHRTNNPPVRCKPVKDSTSVCGRQLVRWTRWRDCAVFSLHWSLVTRHSLSSGRPRCAGCGAGCFRAE